MFPCEPCTLAIGRYAALRRGACPDDPGDARGCRAGVARLAAQERRTVAGTEAPDGCRHRSAGHYRLGAPHIPVCARSTRKKASGDIIATPSCSPSESKSLSRVTM
jgi:hypothetical protein